MKLTIANNESNIAKYHAWWIKKLELSKNLVLVTEQDFTDALSTVKTLSSVEANIKKVKQEHIESAGLAYYDKTSEPTRALRLKLSSQIKTRREEIKQEIIDGFAEASAIMISESTASRAYKNSINTLKLITDGIKGKSANLDKVVQSQLSQLLSGLRANERETQDKMEVINKYDSVHTIDVDALLAMPISTIELILDGRKRALLDRIEREKAKAVSDALIEHEKPPVAEKETAVERAEIPEVVDFHAAPIAKKKYKLSFSVSLSIYAKTKDEAAILARACVDEIDNSDCNFVITEKKLQK